MSLLVAVAVGLGIGATAYFATRKSSVEKPNLPVLASVCGAAMTLFVVTFAFLAVSASQALASARKDTFAEAGALRELYWVTTAMPDQERDWTQSRIRGYAEEVVTGEWPAMARGETSRHAQEVLDELRVHLGQAVRDDPVARGEALSRIHDVYTARRARISNIGVGIPPIMLGALVASAAVALGCVLLIGFPPSWRNIVALGLLAGEIAFGLYLIVQLNHPFGGDVHIGPDAFQQALDRFRARV